MEARCSCRPAELRLKRLAPFRDLFRLGERGADDFVLQRFQKMVRSLQDARAHCQAFFAWYNTEHRHSGIAFMTPHDVHHGRATQVVATRSAAMTAAFDANPVRFKGQHPKPHLPPQPVWINPPVISASSNTEATEQH